MSEIVVSKSGELAKTGPQWMRNSLAKADAVIDYAKKVQDWPLLAEAVDAKLDDQQEFVREYREKISPRHGAGRGNKKNSRDRGAFSPEVSGIPHQKVSRWDSLLKNRETYRDNIILAARRKAELEAGANHRLTSGEFEWYTPADIIRDARIVLGSIDLDPASSQTAQETVGATVFFSVEENGLAKAWFGNVWINPPYSHPEVEMFADKLVHEYTAGRVKSAIMLTNNSTDTGWFHRAQAVAVKLCFTAGRIRFNTSDGLPTKQSPTQGQAFFYFGDEPDAFTSVFSARGFVR